MHDSTFEATEPDICLGYGLDAQDASGLPLVTALEIMVFHVGPHRSLAQLRKVNESWTSRSLGGRKALQAADDLPAVTPAVTPTPTSRHSGA